jgi:hypothetical protein
VTRRKPSQTTTGRLQLLRLFSTLHPGGTQLGPVRKLTTGVLVERNLRFCANSWQRLTLGPRRFRLDATHSPTVNSDQFSDV